MKDVNNSVVNNTKEHTYTPLFLIWQLGLAFIKTQKGVAETKCTVQHITSITSV